MNSSTLSFYGGVGAVTGANFLLESGGKKMLVDCGLEQGGKFCEDVNRKPFSYDPASVDALFVTHAHIDHIGRIPLLVQKGFHGVIYSTAATLELSRIMLIDSMKVLARESKHEGLPPLYEKGDVERAFSLWKIIPYKEKTTVLNTFEVLFKDAGHILGSAIIEFTSVETGKSIAFTGDLGNSPSPLLRDTETVNDVDYLVMESVYGDRVHQHREERGSLLRHVIETTISRGGTLMIPAFSIDRTQVILYEVNNLIEEKKIPPVPVFLDSPLAIAVTDIYKKNTKLFKSDIQDEIKSGDDIFSFPGLRMTNSTEESKEINKVNGPKIIIAGAGMSHGGRIQHHEQRYLPDKNSTLLLVGYQVAGSLGRALQDGAKEVYINRKKVSVRADVAVISGYSAHKDRDGLVDFASHLSKRAKKVFVTMGETSASLFLVQRLRDFLELDAVAPEKGETVILQL